MLVGILIPAGLVLISGGLIWAGKQAWQWWRSR